MGCFSCFDSREDVKLNPENVSDDRNQGHLSSDISRLASGQSCQDP